MSRFFDEANSDSFVAFLKVLQKRFGKLLLFADNASCHKSERVIDYINSANGDIIPAHFPKYAPELNPIGIQWREIKKCVSNAFFAACEDMKASIRSTLRRKEVKIVKLFQYLTP